MHLRIDAPDERIRASGQPLRVYLDSSDYSTLSDARRATPSLEKIRHDLLRFAQSGEVEFRFSGAHICEIAPLNLASQEAAEARADLLAALCGTRALISPTCLIEQELFADGHPVSPYSDYGEWFPTPTPSIGPAKIIEGVRGEIRQSLMNTEGLGRSQRRARLRQLSGRKVEEFITKSLYASREKLIARIKSEYPMRDADAETTYRYICGTATVEEAEDAFFNSLRDPKWMILWFSQHGSQMSRVVQWMREPGEKLSATVMQLASEIPPTEAGERALPPAKVRELKSYLLNSLTQGLAATFFERKGVTPRLIDLEQLPATTPGFYVMLNTVIEAASCTFVRDPRTPQQSDFLDAVHASYAPYVDVFRADRFTGSLLQRTLAGLEVKVVRRLDELVPTIEGLLRMHRERR